MPSAAGRRRRPAAVDADAVPGGVLTRRPPATAFEVHLDVFSGPFDLLLGPHQQAQARHHRGRPRQGDRRVRRAHQGGPGQRQRLGPRRRPRSSCSSRRPCSTSRRPGCCPQSGPEDEEDLALIEARDLLFARLLQYRAFKDIASTFARADGDGGPDHAAPGRTGAAVRRPAPRAGHDRDPRAARHDRGAGHDAQVGRPPSASAHLHAPQVSVREQAAIIVDAAAPRAGRVVPRLVADADTHARHRRPVPRPARAVPRGGHRLRAGGGPRRARPSAGPAPTRATSRSTTSSTRTRTRPRTHHADE